MVPQPHGGALLPGAGAGRQPGAGRPSSAIRARLRESFADRIARLEGIADGRVEITLVGVCEKCGHAREAQPGDTLPVRTAVNDIIRSLEVMAKFGVGTKDEVSVVSDEVRARLLRQIELIVEIVPAPHAQSLLDRLEEVWS